MNNEHKTPAEMLDDALDYIVESTDDAKFTLVEVLGITKESLNAAGIDRFDYIFGDDDSSEKRVLLTADEYNGLLAIARDTKMDCWFSIETIQDSLGDFDVITDLENNTTLSVKEGLRELSEGIVEPLSSDFYHMEDDERAAVAKLFAYYGITVPV